MSTILRVWDDAGVQHYLDLYENEPIKLNYNFSDIQDVGKIFSNFSQTFRVPATEVNIELFGMWFNANLEGNFNPKTKYRADISWATIPQMTGHIKLNQCFISNGKYVDFEIGFFGEISTLARDIGDLKLKDLDLSALNHDITFDNVLASINSNIPALPAGVVRYALVDKGQNFSEIGGVGTRPLSSDDSPLYAGDFTPMVSVKYLLTLILADNGYTYDSDFIDSYLDEVFVLFYNGQLSPSLDVLPVLNNFNVGVTSDDTVALGAAYTISEIGNQSESAPFFDGNGNYTIGTPSYYDSPYYGIFSFDMWLTVTNNEAENIFFRPVLYDINTGEIVAAPEAFYQAFSGETTNYQVNGFNALLTAGQQVALGIQNGFNNIGLDIVIESSAAPDQNEGSGWKCYNSNPLAGGEVVMANNAPDYKQIDFIRDLTKIFNLVFVASKDDSSVLIIEPFQDWIETGNEISWTHKLDISKDIVLRPTTDLQARNLELTYAPDGDVINKAVQEIGGRIYGRQLIDNTENDFATSDQKIETYCSPTPCNTVQGTGIVIPKLINEQGTGILCRPRILFWKKVDTGTNIKIVDDSDDSIQTINYYPYAGHYATPDATVGTDDLNFGAEIPFHNIVATPYRTAFNIYWLNYYNSIYSEFARIMSANFYLTSADLLSLQFNERIFIKDSYWRINKISNYAVGLDALTSVELVKLLDVKIDPLYIPNTPNDDGSVEFVDWEGNLVAGDQASAEQFGYDWSGTAAFIKPIITQVIQQGSTYGSGFGDAKGVSGAFPNTKLPAGFTQGSIIGQGHTLNDASWATVHGFENQLAARISAHLFGKRVLGNWEGLHLGGGFWHECGLSDEVGRAQYGVIMIMAEGDLSAHLNEIELFIEGVNNYRLVLPDDTAWNVEIDITLFDLNPATMNLAGQQSMNYLLCLSKTGGLAASTGTPSSTLREIGSYSAKFEIVIDTATDTTQHRLSLRTTTGSGLPAYGVKATASLKYTQVKSNCIPSS